MSDENAPTGVLHIDGIVLPGGGCIGLTHFPGRRGTDGIGRDWRRDLDADFAAIADWRASALVTLVEETEFATYGAGDFAARVRRQPFQWHHIPIPDMQTPSAEALKHWQQLAPQFAQSIRRGERVVVHCAAGLGRTGMMVARLLVDQFGYQPEAAIEVVRAHRPGTIETPRQEAFVRDLPLR
jgi:protein-tyrosine phosphatase